MPALGNQRHEGFCRAICRGESASGAYASIYHVSGRTAEVNGSKLLRNTVVAARIAELQGMAAKRTAKSVESLVVNLDEAIDFAKRCRSPAAVVSAIGLQAKLLGLLAPTQLEIIRHAPAPLPTKLLELSEDEWRAQFGSGTGPKPALAGTKRSMAEKRKMNAGAHGGKPVAVVPSAIEWDAETAPIRAAGIIDLD
ncbi:terminase small subunit [Rhizobium sp. LEGMi198b]